MYALNAQGEITRMHAMRLHEARGRLEFGSVREINQQTIDEMLATIRQLKELNRDIWTYLPRLEQHLTPDTPVPPV
jgi:hypothetical protein